MGEGDRRRGERAWASAADSVARRVGVLSRAGSTERGRRAREISRSRKATSWGVRWARLEAGLLEDGVVVSPAGIADVDQAARAVHGDELRRDAQRAGAGEGLHDGDALLLDEGRVGAEYDLSGLRQERLQPLQWNRRVSTNGSIFQL